jgi:hypothetical protein
MLLARASVLTANWQNTPVLTELPTKINTNICKVSVEYFLEWDNLWSRQALGPLLGPLCAPVFSRALSPTLEPELVCLRPY